jgi:hypothetical protein
MGLFWEAYFPHGRSVPPNLARTHSCGWTEVAQRLCTKNESVRLALLANALRTVGSRDGKPWVVMEGLKLYSLSLRKLVASLRTLDKSNHDSLLITAKLLGTFEVRFVLKFLWLEQVSNLILFV